MSEPANGRSLKRFVPIYFLGALLAPVAAYIGVGIVGALSMLGALTAACLFILRRAQMTEAGALRLIAKYSIGAILVSGVSAFSLVALANNFIDKLQSTAGCHLQARDWICRIPQIPDLSTAQEWVLFASVTVAIVALNFIWFVLRRRGPPQVSVQGNVVIGDVRDSTVVSVSVERDASRRSERP